MNKKKPLIINKLKELGFAKRKSLEIPEITSKV